MALNISPVHRNLHTRVSFLYLEFEDWFVVIGLAALTNIFGRWIDRHMFGIPMNVFLQYIVPVLSIPFLMLFKYGKPRRLSERFSGLAHQAPDLLRTRAGFGNEARLLQRGGDRCQRLSNSIRHLCTSRRSPSCCRCATS